MFKVFLLSASVLFFSFDASAQDSAPKSSEALLSKYLNASAVCAKMTDAEKLYNRALLLMKDDNEEAYLAASECLTSAAMRNHTGAQLELGKLYETGKGVNASNIFAYKWLQTAVLLGNKDAISYRDELESRMDLDDIAMANPMIQSTLNLIDQYEQHRAKEISEFEKTVAGEYKKFGVDVGKYEDTKSEAKERKADSMLIEALIRDQEAAEKKQKAAKSSLQQPPSFLRRGNASAKTEDKGF